MLPLHFIACPTIVTHNYTTSTFSTTTSSYLSSSSSSWPSSSPNQQAAFLLPPPSSSSPSPSPPFSPLCMITPSPNSSLAIDIDGKSIAQTIRDEIKRDVAALIRDHSIYPGLAVVIVGTRKDSQTYVRSKHKACEEAGIRSFAYELDDGVQQSVLEDLIDDLNARDDVHGILVQLPLPDYMDGDKVLQKICLEKDVDGFHPVNIGRLCMKARQEALFIPCTPKGCIELLKRSNIPISGKHAVILGRSNIVGLPVSMLLLHENATITICHSRTVDLPQQVRQADILIASIGKAQYVQADWLKPGAVVIDVGINAVDDPTSKKGYKLVGDVDYAQCKKVASAITPVPGGVGPMTIAMLLRNTLDAAMRKIDQK